MKPIPHHTAEAYLGRGSPAVKTSTFVDRSGWPAGPWDLEPDRVEWRDRGFPCLMLRHPNAGHWCGYVAVPPGHPWHGRVPYGVGDDHKWGGPDCHGGVTFASPCADDREGDPGAVCHLPLPGEPAEVWWIGFDCAHCDDASPGWLTRKRVYRAVDFVRTQATHLVNQAIKAASGGEGHDALLGERQELLDKLFAGTITQKEERRLECVRRNLDRIEDALRVDPHVLVGETRRSSTRAGMVLHVDVYGVAACGAGRLHLVREGVPGGAEWDEWVCRRAACQRRWGGSR